MSRKLESPWSFIFLLFSALAILLAINQLFRLKLFGFLPLDNAYLYYLLALYLSPAFLLYPATKAAPREKAPWYDIALFLLTVVLNLYFGLHGLEIIRLGWEWTAPAVATAFSILLWLFTLEAVRRAQGLPLTVICFLFSLYPLFAGHLPGIFKGQAYDFLAVARLHALSVNSILGIPLATIGNLLIGFMLFGVVLQITGGGAFFFNLAQALLGYARGGPAKISVLSSAFFGMLSGSAVSNVVTTGTMTIPTMKRIGYPPHYAAAIESCASTGGTIMPPIMGAAAFVMASFLNVPYASIVIAAVIPAFLYYWGIFVQVDGYAARTGLKGIPRQELPSFWGTLKSGWYYLFVLLILCYFLLVLRVEAWAPFYASALLLILAAFRRETRLNWRKFLDVIAGTGRVLVELVVIVAAVGLLVGSLSATGVALSFSRELVVAVGNNALLILLAGALTSFVLGMGMTATACYIFLAIVMVPALVSLGIDPMAAHLFVLYWGIISYITPPVAIAAYAASGIAGANAMQTGWTATRIGIVLYFIPFFFVYNPALIAHGSWPEIISAFFTATLGVFCLGCALEGFLIGIGRLRAPFLRAALLLAGVLLAFPHVPTDFAGILLAVGVGGAAYLLEKKKGPAEQEKVSCGG